MNNPNFYQSIDEFDEKKIDHLYDEIKQKEGFNPGEFRKPETEVFSFIIIINNYKIFHFFFRIRIRSPRLQQAGKFVETKLSKDAESIFKRIKYDDRFERRQQFIKYFKFKY